MNVAMILTRSGKLVNNINAPRRKAGELDMRWCSSTWTSNKPLVLDPRVFTNCWNLSSASQPSRTEGTSVAS